VQITHDFETASALPVNWGVRVLMLAGTEAAPVVAKVGAIAGPVEVLTEVYAALSAIIDDPTGYGLFVVDLDSTGGAETGARALSTLAAVQSRVPVILVSRDHVRQNFPQDRGQPVCLRAPLSAVSLRVGLEHALRDRLLWNAA
jgi:hypothetical protein